MVPEWFYILLSVVIGLVVVFAIAPLVHVFIMWWSYWLL